MDLDLFDKIGREAVRYQEQIDLMADQEADTMVDDLTLKILKHVAKHKNITYLDLQNKFHTQSNIDFQIIMSVLSSDHFVSIQRAENGNFIDSSPVQLTLKSERTISFARQSMIERWQSYLIPNILNIAVSMITTILTYYILQFLNR